MKIIPPLILSFVLILITACNKSDKTETYEVGIYKPYKQEVSSVNARTIDGPIDGSNINLNSIPVINGTGNTGEIHFKGFGTDQLIEPKIRIDSIKMATSGKATVYPNFFENSSREIVRIDDSLFLVPTDTSLKFLRFYPCCTNPIILSDRQKVAFHMTTRGKFIINGFILFHYDIFVKSSSDTRGTINADYLDLAYLNQVLEKGDTLIYVKRATYFKRD